MTSLPRQEPAPAADLTPLTAAEIDAVGGGLDVGRFIDNVNRTVFLITMGIELTIGLLASKKC